MGKIARVSRRAFSLLEKILTYSDLGWVMNITTPGSFRACTYEKVSQIFTDLPSSVGLQIPLGL